MEECFGRKINLESVKLNVRLVRFFKPVEFDRFNFNQNAVKTI